MTRQNPVWIQTAGVEPDEFPTYPARLDRMLIYNTFTEGVLTGFVVTQRAAGANMTVDISVGYAVIYGDDQGFQHAYMINGDTIDSVTITAAPGSGSRTDLIYARVNDPNAGGPAGLNWVFSVLPNSIVVPTTAIAIATVMVSAGNTSVVNTMIEDARIASRVKGSAPFGSVKDFTGAMADIPSDYLASFGQEVNRTTYFGLHNVYKAAGYPHGAGNGVTTFNLPDYRGVTSVGLDNMGGIDRGLLTSANTLGLKVGTELVQLSLAHLASHSHIVASHAHGGITGLENQTHSHSGSGQTAGFNTNHTHNFITNSDGAHSHNLGAEGIIYGEDRHASGLEYAVGAIGGTGIQALPEGSQHQHSGTTGGVSTDHSHAYSFTTAGENQYHTHNINVEAPGTNSAGSDTAHPNMQPSILVNKIIRAL